MSSLRRILGISKSSFHFSEYCIFSSSSSWSDCRPPSNFVNAHVSIIELYGSSSDEVSSDSVSVLALTCLSVSDLAEIMTMYGLGRLSDWTFPLDIFPDNFPHRRPPLSHVQWRKTPCSTDKLYNVTTSTVNWIYVKKTAFRHELTANDTSQTAKITKRWYYPPAHRLNVNVLLSNITFL